MIHALEGVASFTRRTCSVCRTEQEPAAMVECWDFIAIWAAEFPGKFQRPELCSNCERILKLTPPEEQAP